MDARQTRSASSRIERCAIALLAVIVASGLWQGYSVLLQGASAHVH